MGIDITIKDAEGENNKDKYYIVDRETIYKVTEERLIPELRRLNNSYSGKGGINVISYLNPESQAGKDVSEWTKDPIAFLMRRAKRPETAYELQALLEKSDIEKLGRRMFIAGEYDVTISEYCENNKSQRPEEGKEGVEGCGKRGIRESDVEDCRERNKRCIFFSCSLPAEKGKGNYDSVEPASRDKKIRELEWMIKRLKTDLRTAKKQNPFINRGDGSM